MEVFLFSIWCSAYLHGWRQHALYFMNKYKRSFLFILMGCLALCLFLFCRPGQKPDLFISYTVDPKQQQLGLYWKDSKGQPLRSILALKTLVETKQQQLVFAMNGGMYKTDNSPLGLYIENFKTLSPLNTAFGKGNFYLQPNGVFFINANNEPGICATPDFKKQATIKFATQSGPMLVTDGNIHPVFTKGSTSLYVRNGVGILPGNKAVFVMSKQPVNFFDFACHFKTLGCQQALYLDGFVSRTYLPEKNQIQTDGNFGVLIGVTH